MRKNNLIPNSERTPEELRAITTKGGIASGVARRKKKLMKEQINLLLSLPLKDEKAKKQLEALGIDTENIDNQMAMVIKMWQTSLSGGKNSVQAATFLRDTVGEKPIDEVVNTNINTNKLDNIINQLKE